MSSDDEPDYMSDKFVFESEKNDLRPGLIHNRSEQRKHNVLKKKALTDQQNKMRNRPYNVIEQERRAEGLQNAISSENKGFALLQKMGYKPGSGIGKSGSGRVEPINIDVKTDRCGLGRKEALRLIGEAKIAMIKERIDQCNKRLNVEDFQARKSRERAEKQVLSDLQRSQRICFQLDQREGHEPTESWFWPEKAIPKSEVDGPDDDEVCPGTDEEEEEEEEEGNSDEDSEPTIELTPSDKLEIITLYLRTTYFYCCWCGTEYSDHDDLEENCPGSSRDLHE